MIESSPDLHLEIVRPTHYGGHYGGPGTGTKKVSAAVWNLVAAILCTVGPGIGTYGLYLLYAAQPSDINFIFYIGGIIGTVGGAAWIVSAIIGIILVRKR